jgi:hypothetical protein
MAKLRLNKSDKDDIIQDVQKFALGKYEMSELGDERRAIIREIQAIADEVVAEAVPDQDMAILQKHNCIENHKDLSVSLFIRKEQGRHPLVTTSSWGYSKFIFFMSFNLTFPIINSTGGPGTNTGAVIKNRILEHINAGSEQSIASRLWNLSDKMNCEVNKIVSSYRNGLESQKTWEDAIENLKGLRIMVDPDTIEKIRQSKEPQKGIDLDPQVVLFGKEAEEEVKNAKPKGKKRN